MGKSKKVTVGFWYSMGLHMGICAGPVDKVLKIFGGGLQAYAGEITQSQDLRVRMRNLYGGEKKEGGIDGIFSICMGEPDQVTHPYLVSQLGSRQSAYRGLLTIVFRGVVGAMNPYVKAMSFQVARWVKGWRTDVWEPDLAKVGKGLNGAHYVYRAITDPVTGLGKDPNQALDLVRMKAAAQTLYDEGTGMCLKWSRSDVVNNFIGIICDHVGGEFATDPTTNKQFLRLYRGGYDVEALPVIDESNILELTSHEQAALYGSTNTITVTYRDCETNKDANVTVHNPANIQAQRQVIPKPISYPGFWNAQLAIMAATRELHAVSSLPARGKVKLPMPLTAMVSGVLQEVEIMKGDILALSWKLFFLVKLPIRVLEIDRGGPTDNAIVVTYTTDVNALPTQNYVVGQPSLWVPTDTTPLPIPDARLVEASYRDLAGTLRAADLAVLTEDAGYVGSLGIRPSNIAYNYTLQTRVGTTGNFTERGPGDFTPTGLLPNPIPAAATPVSIVLSSPRNLDLVSVGSEVMIDDEVLRLDAIDSDTGAITLARGCVDTVPAAHVAGARVWFTDDFTGGDPTEYMAGEVVQAKLLTRTTAGELDPAFAPIVSTAIARRQARPYPPANLKVRGGVYPVSIEGALVLAWSHRDRVLQADQLVDTAQPDIGPEPGTTYTVRVYVDNVLDNTTPGITATTFTPAVSADGVVRVEIDAVRDDLASWQSLTATFNYTRGEARLTEDGDTRITEAGEARITES
ncbi:MAG: hypothetical protein WBW32_15400 [Luteibacter sp.]